MCLQKSIILIGIPGIGKSTWINKNKEVENIDEIFSSDEYRKKLCGDETIQNKNNFIFKCLYKDMEQALKNGLNICLDATNIKIKERKKFINMCKNINPSIYIKAIVFPLDRELAIRRDSERSRNVGIEVIDKFIHKYEQIEGNECFNEVLFI